jgi:hypothetical protein
LSMYFYHLAVADTPTGRLLPPEGAPVEAEPGPEPRALLSALTNSPHDDRQAQALAPLLTACWGLRLRRGVVRLPLSRHR